MNAQVQKSPAQIEAQLNETPLSKRIASMFSLEEESPEPGLLLGSLAFRALNPDEAANPEWAEQVQGAVAAAERDDPEALYRSLEQAPGLAQAKTLDEAGQAIKALLLDLYPPRDLA